MQKQLLIIGNGFDLSCGLKSRYSDFFEAEIKDKYNPMNNEINNFWHKLLCVYDSYFLNTKTYNWCDIERIIRDILNSINFGGTDFWTNDEKLTDEPPIFDEIWKHSVRSVSNGKAYENVDLDGPDVIYRFILNYGYSFTYENIKGIELRNLIGQPALWAIRDFNTHLLEELKNLERLFCEYLKKQVGSDAYCKKARILFNKLYTFDFDGKILDKKNSDLHSTFWENTSVLSFNYTTPLLGMPDKMSLSYSNVHGILCDKDCKSCQSSSVIFGIDDNDTKTVKSEKIRKTNLNIFSKTYRTLFLPKNCQAVVLPKLRVEYVTFHDMGVGGDSLRIKFFGHSLNEADYSYFQSIFDYYKIYDSQYIWLEFYYSPFKESAKQEATEAVYNLINQYGLTLNNKDQGQNLMHKLILEKRIKIIELRV